MIRYDAAGIAFLDLTEKLGRFTDHDRGETVFPRRERFSELRVSSVVILEIILAEI